MRQRMSLQAFTTGALLLAAACSDQSEPAAPSDQPEPSPIQPAIQGTQIDPIPSGAPFEGSAASTSTPRAPQSSI
jgi:hypothetical protein